MRSNAGRKPGFGGQRGKGKSPWLVFCLFGVLAVLWVSVTLVLIPKELADISITLSDQKHQESGEAYIPKRHIRHVIDSGPRPANKLTIGEIMHSMRSFLDELHGNYDGMTDPEPGSIWDIYKRTTDKWLLPMDRDNKGRNLFDVRDDNSIFVSLASYRDENCPRTLNEMFSKADHPEDLFIGLVQQNCVSGCRSGVLEGQIVEDVEPDIDCYQTFCNTELGEKWCQAGHVRNFFVQEAESLGPAVARYFASKLWHGETFFMQIDAHSLFVDSWDTSLVNDILSTPSYPQSVLSHYPPDTKVKYADQPGYRICGSIIAESQVEYQIVRLSAGVPHDRVIQEKPCPAPFIGAGFFFAHSSFLGKIPFDPYVPWVFMGEEILLSLRFWTWGYDIYGPTRNVLSHMYVRRHTPKFWESVNRVFHKPSIHNELTSMLIHRVKHIAGYPESSTEIMASTTPSLIEDLDLYGEGPVRAVEDYMGLVGLDLVSKHATPEIKWCAQCVAPYPVL